MGMTIEDCIHKLDFSISAYQKLIDENVANGEVVGTGVRGTWTASTPLNKAYSDMIEALQTAKETMRKYQKMQSDYENRLKADLVAMLTELQLEIEESENCGKAFHLGLQMASNIIQQKINALKGVEIDKAKWKPFDSTIPLEDGDYLVTYEDPQTHKLEVLIARYHMAEHEEDECRFYDDTGIEITLAVKAWQPLPEPYEPQESEDT